jgi:phage terminase large subunit-like protein
MNLPPRYGTRRRIERPTTGVAVELLARRFGVELLPWQRHVSRVAGELLADGTHAYSTVIVGVGRRAGKSLLTFLELLTVTLSRRRRAWYTAQSRADAALTFRDEWVPLIDHSPLAGRVRCRLANGSEAFTLPALGSFARVFAPTPTALHGQAGDLIMFDEAWSHTAERGAELMIAARPLMATRPGAQLWILSAAGDTDSSWWLEQLEVGRTAAAADTGTGICHFEWSADDPDLDLDDRATWLAAHPAVRSEANPAGTITLEWLEAEWALDRHAFYRTYLNVTDRAGVTVSPLDPITWATRAELTEWDRTVGSLVAGVDCSANQETTSIVVAGEVAGRIVVELIDRRPGTAWAIERLAELCDTWRLEAVALDAAGPARALLADLEVAGVPTVALEQRDVAAAAARFVEAIRTDAVHYRPAPDLDAAVGAARRRPLGDGSWTFRRVGAAADMAPLIAASLARAVHPAVGSPAPAVY